MVYRAGNDGIFIIVIANSAHSSNDFHRRDQLLRELIAPVVLLALAVGDQDGLAIGIPLNRADDPFGSRGGNCAVEQIVSKIGDFAVAIGRVLRARADQPISRS